MVLAPSRKVACLIPDLLGRFTTEWPGVRLELQQGDSREIIGLLHNDLVELALVGGQYDEDAVSFKEILTDRIILVGRPWDQKDGTLSIQELQDQPLIVRELGDVVIDDGRKILRNCDFPEF